MFIWYKSSSIRNILINYEKHILFASYNTTLNLPSMLIPLHLALLLWQTQTKHSSVCTCQSFYNCWSFLWFNHIFAPTFFFAFIVIVAISQTRHWICPIIILCFCSFAMVLRLILAKIIIIKEALCLLFFSIYHCQNMIRIISRDCIAFSVSDDVFMKVHSYLHDGWV